MSTKFGWNLEFINARDIAVYQLAEILETERSRVLLKAHILTGCDVTSKTGSKSAACKACPEKHLYDFGKEARMTEKYLVKVIKPNIAAESFDDLRYVIYATRKTIFQNKLVHPQQLKDNCYELAAS